MKKWGFKKFGEGFGGHKKSKNTSASQSNRLITFQATPTLSKFNNYMSKNKNLNPIFEGSPNTTSLRHILKKRQPTQKKFQDGNKSQNRTMLKIVNKSQILKP